MNFSGAQGQVASHSQLLAKTPGRPTWAIAPQTERQLVPSKTQAVSAKQRPSPRPSQTHGSNSSGPASNGWFVRPASFAVVPASTPASTLSTG